MPHLRVPTHWRILSSGSLLLLVLILASCGASAGMSTQSSAAHSSSFPGTDNSGASGGATSGKQAAAAPDQLRMPNAVSQQHLIKTLNVSLSVKDTRQVANDLQSWIGSTDPLASSVGTNYNQISDGVYNITLNFSVQYTLYPKIYRYLSNYTPKDGGYLSSLNETVQDVSNDYVDTQARIKNYQNELQTLRTIMQSASNLNDTLTLEQKISDVEGNIETTQAHLNELSNQTTMYTVNITIQPIGSATPPIQPSSGWNLGQTLRDAFSASLAFAQALLSFIIWLLAFSVYLIPLIFLVVLYRRYQTRKQSARPAYYNRPAPTQARPMPVPTTTYPQPSPVGTAAGKAEEPELDEVPIHTPSSDL